MNKILMIMFTAAFAKNIVFSYQMGFEDSQKNPDTVSLTLKYGAVLAAVMTLSSALSWIVREYILDRFSLVYLKTVAYVFIAVAVTLAVSVVLRKTSFYDESEKFFDKICINFAVLGVIFILDKSKLGFADSVIYGLFSSVGFLIASFLFVGIRERLLFSDIPKCFRGIPILLVSAGLVALAFSGFTGLKF